MNYGYQEINLLSPEQVLQKVTALQIFGLLFKHPIRFGEKVISPFRKDKTPGAFFTQREDSTIIFVDYAEKLRGGNTHRTCFRGVMDLYNTSLQGAIIIICKEFGLSSDISDYDNVVSTNNYDYSQQDKRETEIEYVKKIPTKEDKIFWSQWLITMPQFESDNNFCVKNYTIRKYKVSHFSPYKYCYVFDFLDKKKIFNPMGNPKYKWISNCDEDNIGNFDNLPPTGKQLIIQKSYKDHRVLRNLDMNLNVIWFQNEGCIPSIDILKNLSDRFEEIIIFYDNDLGGVTAARRLRDVFNMLRLNSSKVIYLPRTNHHLSKHGKFLKDPGEFINKEGNKELFTVIKHLDLYADT